MAGYMHPPGQPTVYPATLPGGDGTSIPGAAIEAREGGDGVEPAPATAQRWPRRPVRVAAFTVRERARCYTGGAELATLPRPSPAATSPSRGPTCRGPDHGAAR